MTSNNLKSYWHLPGCSIQFPSLASVKASVMAAVNVDGDAWEWDNECIVHYLNGAKYSLVYVFADDDHRIHFSRPQRL